MDPLHHAVRPGAVAVWDREAWGMLADDVAALAPDESETVGDV